MSHYSAMMGHSQIEFIFQNFSEPDFEIFVQLRKSDFYFYDSNDQNNLFHRRNCNKILEFTITLYH